MNYDLDADQDALISGLQVVLRPYNDISNAHRRSSSYFPEGLQRVLRESGFLEVIAQGLSPLDAGLVVLEIARSPCAVEAGASALVWPAVLDSTPEGPVALVEGDLSKATRFLSVARHALIDTGGDLVVVDVAPGDVSPVDTILAYPFGRFVDPTIVSRGRSLGMEKLAIARRWKRIALALEFAGATESAVAFTVDYVKQRHVFGRPVGSFQAVQHRLAQCHQIARGILYTALFAAWKGDDVSGNIAANYAQRHTGRLAFDLHQFNGGLGVTNEHLLHFWTHRLRALQGEVGGADAAALAIADQLWPSTPGSNSGERIPRTTH